MTKATERVLQSKFGGGYLDRKYLNRIAENCDMEYDRENINHINQIIRCVFEEKITTMVESERELLKKKGIDTEEFQEILTDAIYTNCLDSGIMYNDEDKEIEKLIRELE